MTVLRGRLATPVRHKGPDSHSANRRLRRPPEAAPLAMAVSSGGVAGHRGRRRFQCGGRDARPRLARLQRQAVWRGHRVARRAPSRRMKCPGLGPRFAAPTAEWSGLFQKFQRRASRLPPRAAYRARSAPRTPPRRRSGAVIASLGRPRCE
jgi:hypothetical protein